MSTYCYACAKNSTVLGLIPEKVEVGNKKSRKNTRKDRNFSPLRSSKPLTRIPTYTPLSLLMFFRAGVPIQTVDVVLEMFRTKNRLSLGWWVGFSRGVVWYSSSDTVTIDFDSLVRVGSVYRNCTKQHLLRMYQRKCVRYCSVKNPTGGFICL